MPPTKQDNFPNVLKAAVTMSAANALTFEEIKVGLNLFDKVGLIVHRVHYSVTLASYAELYSDADELAIGLVGDDNVVTMNPDDRWTLDSMSLQANDDGVAANFVIGKFPIVHDFSGMPGGGLLIPPKPLYMAMDTAGYGAAASGFANIFFTIKPLKDADYFELLETFRFFG